MIGDKNKYQIKKFPLSHSLYERGNKEEKSFTKILL